MWAAVALAAFFLQAGARLLIEAADLRRAHDHVWQTSKRRSRLTPGRVVAAAGICFAATLALGVLALIERGWPLFWLGLAGVLGAAVYSHGPALRDRALGPLLSFVLLGPAAVVTGYYAVTGAWSPLAMRVSIPLGLLAAATTLAREIRDVVDDERAGAVTLASLARRPLSDALLYALIAGAYLWLLYLVAGGMLAPACLLPLLTLPAAIGVVREVRSTSEDSQETSGFAGRTARLYLRFAALYAASVALSEIVWKRAV